MKRAPLLSLRTLISCTVAIVVLYHASAIGAETALSTKLEDYASRASDSSFRVPESFNAITVPQETRTLDKLFEFVNLKIADTKYSLNMDDSIQSVQIDIVDLPNLPSFALLQALSCRYGYVVKVDKTSQTISVEKAREAWGTQAEIENELVPLIDKTLTNEKDLGKLAYLIASLPYLGDKGYSKLNTLTHDPNREVAWTAENTLLVAPIPFDRWSMVVPTIQRDRMLAKAATRMLFSRADPRSFASQLDSAFSSFEGKFLQDTMNQFRQQYEFCLKGGVKLEKRHIPILRVLKKLYALDNEMTTTLDSIIGKLAEPELLEEPLDLRPFAAILEEYLAQVSDTNKQFFNKSWRYAPTATDIPLDLIVKTYTAHWDPKLEVLVKNKQASETKVTIENLPAFNYIPWFQLIAVPHGFVVKYDGKKVEIRTLEYAWGLRDVIWPAIKKKCQDAAISEKDWGKLGYLFSSLLAFQDRGVDTLIEMTRHECPEIRFIALLVLADYEKTVDPSRVSQALLDPIGYVRAAAMSLLLLNGDPETSGKLIEKIASVVPSDGWRKMLEDSLLQCAENRIYIVPRQKPLVQTLKNMFSDDAVLSTYFEKALKKMEAK